MSLTVKAYLLGKDEAVKEIRRFTVDHDVPYSYLSRTTAEVFNNVKSFSLYYRDEDGDLVALSSDNELMIGLACVKDNTFHLLIKEKKKHCWDFPLHVSPRFAFGPRSRHGSPPRHFPPPHHGSSPPAFHRNIVCDGCDGPVFGTRYKCLICFDYDLCCTCQAQGFHTEHAMLPISQPLQ